MKKSSNHRKRHVPPGPCGIWFQSQQQLNQQSTSSRKARRTPGDGTGDGLGNSLDVPFNTQDNTNDKSHDGVVEDMSFSPAWTFMQQELDLITPYLPPTLTDSSERYRQLRPHMPQEYALLWEVQQGQYDFCFDSTSRSLLVLVTRVESHIHHNIWTVELQDETGVTMKAWIEPAFVQKQLKQPHELSCIRTGVVWCLQNIGMLVVRPPPTEDEDRLERMLLIRGSAIGSLWTPEATKLHNQENDSPGRQRQFLEWMEKRKALPVLDSTQDDSPEFESGGVDQEHDDVVETRTLSGIPTRSVSTVHNSVDEDEENDEDDFAPSSAPGFMAPVAQGTTMTSTSQITPGLDTQESSSRHPWTRLCLGDIPASPQRQPESSFVQKPKQRKEPEKLPTHLTTTSTRPATSQQATQEQNIDTSVPVADTPRDYNGSSTIKGSNPPTHVPARKSKHGGSIWNNLSTQNAAGSLWNMMDDDDDDDEEEHMSETPNRASSTHKAPPTHETVETATNNSKANQASQPDNVDADDDDDDDDFQTPATTSMASLFQTGAMNLPDFSDDDD